MKSVEISAKTVGEAIEIALKELDIERRQGKVTVLNEGRSGILGIGTESASVKVEVIERPVTTGPDIPEIAQEALQTLIDLMDLDGTVEQSFPVIPAGQDDATNPVSFEIKGDDLGILIGRRGQTLAVLQYVLRLIISHKTGVWASVVIDVEGYKERRNEAIRALAQGIADRVKSRSVPFTLEPMPAYERRIVHMALAESSDVVTESIGEGEGRKVVVSPKRRGRSHNWNTKEEL